MQDDLFSQGDAINQHLLSGESIALPDAELYYLKPDWAIPPNNIYQSLMALDWQQEILTVAGKDHKIPRLQAFYGQPHVYYEYSKQRFDAIAWTDLLLNIKHLAEAEINRLSGRLIDFNCVLGNWYRDGQDTMGAHADDESELGSQPVIASLSFGATRTFKLKHKRTKQVCDIELESGSLLIMAGTTQQFWYHSLPKRARVSQGRINLTYRTIFR